MPRLSFQRSADRSSAVVGPSGNRYDCPDLDAVDRHLDALRRQATQAWSTDELAVIRADIDVLLDGRLQLTAAVACAEPTARASR